MIAMIEPLEAGAEAELEVRELRYRQIVELASEGIASVDADGRIVYANGRLAEMLGHRAEELFGRSVFDVVAPASVGRMTRHLAARHGVDGDRQRLDLQRSDGTVLETLIASTARPDGDDELSVVWFTDLRELHLVRAELTHQERQLSALFEAMPDLVVRLGVDGIVLDAHAPASMPLLMPIDEFVGIRFEELLSAVGAQHVGVAIRAAINRLIESERGTETVHYDLSYGGVDHHFEARLVQVNPDEVIAVVRDVTELHRAGQRRVERDRQLVQQQAALERASLERELERASRVEAMGYLAATMAHDVNNLLGVINNYASAIRRSDPAPAVQRDAEEISAAVARGAELTQALLRIGRRPEEQRTVEPLRDLVASLSNSLRTAFDGVVGDLVTDLPQDPAPVHASRSRVEQAIMNLVLNARDAAVAAGGEVDVTLAVEVRDAGPGDWRPEGLDPGRYVLVSVVDGGGGIPDQVRPRIFEPFFSTKDGSNSGLGLPIVREVAEQHGGGVGIHAAVVDGVAGTRMELWLPSTERTTPTGDHEVSHGTPVRVLLVDDDDAVRRSTRQLLESLGYVVDDAHSASTALAALSSGSGVDLVVSDVRMPGTTGPELLRRLRVLVPGLPAVFVTGYTHDLAGAEDLRDVPVLTKPYDVDQLVEVLATLVADN